MSKQIYLIADASLPVDILSEKLRTAAENGIAKLQLYNAEECPPQHLRKFKKICSGNGVQLFVYNNPALARTIGADGVHFDELPDSIQELRSLRIGITVGNEAEKIAAAEQLGADYISFCSIFPTNSATTCTLVDPEMIPGARRLFSREIFLAGGISEQSIPLLKGLDFDGVAVISEIMEARDVAEKIQNLKTILA